MPVATEQDKERRFWTEMVGFFQPNGLGQPNNVINPEGVTLVHSVTPGVYTLTLPASYTASAIVGYAMFANESKSFQTQIPIYSFAILGAGVPAFPVISCILYRQSDGATGPFTLTGEDKIIWNLFLKFNTVVA